MRKIANTVWLSYQNRKYRVDPKERYRQGVITTQGSSPKKSVKKLTLSALGNLPPATTAFAQPNLTELFYSQDIDL